MSHLFTVIIKKAISIKKICTENYGNMLNLRSL